VSREPTVLLIGDVSFMHDVGGLAAAREARGSLTLILIDNGGGRIFEQLPIFEQLGQRRDASRFWLTPPDADFSHAARLYGHRYTRLDRAEGIASALQEATAQAGVHVIHIVVDGASAREAEQRVRAALEAPTEHPE